MDGQGSKEDYRFRKGKNQKANIKPLNFAGIILICSRRLEKSGDRRDFLSLAVDKVRSGKLSEEELAAHCSIIAFVTTPHPISHQQLRLT